LSNILFNIVLSHGILSLFWSVSVNVDAPTYQLQLLPVAYPHSDSSVLCSTHKASYHVHSLDLSLQLQRSAILSLDGCWFRRHDSECKGGDGRDRANESIAIDNSVKIKDEMNLEMFNLLQKSVREAIYQRKDVQGMFTASRIECGQAE
jgi:hypothetical protein